MRIWIALVVLAFGLAAQAQVKPERPNIPLTAEQEVRFKELLPQLRCLVCQNESIADSQADLALDLKYEVRGLVASGKSDPEIKKYLTDRYGDFVLFKPPFDPRTFLLWFGPMLLVLIGLLLAIGFIRKTHKAKAPAAPVDPEALQKILDEQQ